MWLSHEFRENRVKLYGKVACGAIGEIKWKIRLKARDPMYKVELSLFLSAQNKFFYFILLNPSEVYKKRKIHNFYKWPTKNYDQFLCFYIKEITFTEHTLPRFSGKL